MQMARSMSVSKVAGNSWVASSSFIVSDLAHVLGVLPEEQEVAMLDGAPV